jgi:asparagine synthase (glutamine-hydrolysing)
MRIITAKGAFGRRPIPVMLQTIMRLIGRAQRIAQDMDTPDVIKQVEKRKLTYLERAALLWLAEQVRIIEHDNIPGAIVETGCALGGSSIVIATLKKRERRFEVYDVFGQIPPPSEKDGADVQARYEIIASGKSSGIGDDPYYGYDRDLLGKVTGNFETLGVSPGKHNVHLIQGLYEDSLHPAGPIAFAHIDCDWYDSVMVCLQRIVPLLSPGGRIVIDDYFAYSGCRAAIWDYFRPQIDRYKFVYGPRLLITSAT